MNPLNVTWVIFIRLKYTLKLSLSILTAKHKWKSNILVFFIIRNSIEDDDVNLCNWGINHVYGVS